MQYPIIHVFSTDNNIYAKDNGPEFASISQLHKFVGSIIFDSNGVQYTVKGVEKIGWRYLMGFHPLMKGRTAKIRYSFLKVQQLDLEEFKNEIIRKLDKGA